MSKETRTQTNTWTNGALSSIRITNMGTHKEDNETEKENINTEKIITLTYGTQRNTLIQMPYSIANYCFKILPDSIQMLALLGMLGVGPVVLPESETGTDIGGYTISYNLNGNGTIHSETYERRNYRYDNPWPKIYSYE